MNLPNLIINAGATCLLVGSIMDTVAHLKMRMNGGYESNRRFQDKNGFFSTKKYWIVTVAYLAVYFIVARLFILGSEDSLQGATLAAAFTALFGIFRVYMYFQTAKENKELRTRMIRIIKHPFDPNLQVKKAPAGHFFGRPFSFFTSQKDNPVEALGEIRGKVIRLGALDKDLWFDPKTIEFINRNEN